MPAIMARNVVRASEEKFTGAFFYNDAEPHRIVARTFLLSRREGMPNAMENFLPRFPLSKQ